MSSEFGNRLKVSVFGQSHGKAIGVVVDGLPAGEAVDREALNAFMARRRPGGLLATSRKEGDEPVFLAGLEQDKTCGTPLCAIIENKDARSGDYSPFKDCPRPSHADYTAFIKWKGEADMRGGGHFSGRLTASLCIAGGIAKQLLERRGIYIGAHLAEAGGVKDEAFPLWPAKELFEAVQARPLPVIDEAAGEKMKEAIAAAAAEEDSVGGIVECAVIGLPAGMGDPMFDGVENHLAKAIFGIPAVKGLEFGAGFESARKRGSENNDPFGIDEEGNIITLKNDSGGIQGGITNGMPLILRAAFKSTPSIGKAQQSVSLSRREPETLTIGGRHDPCVAHRATPVVEAVTALVILDMLLEEE